MASAFSAFPLLLALTFASSLRLLLAFALVGVALATAVLGLAFKLCQKALLTVALILVVPPLAAKGTGDGAPVVVRHLGLSTSVALLLLTLDYEALVLVAVGGMQETALLILSVTIEEIFYTAHVAIILRGSPMSRSRSLITTAMVPRFASSGAVSVEVLVTLLLQRQLQ